VSDPDFDADLDAFVDAFVAAHPDGATTEEVAAAFGVSADMVEQIERRALPRMRAAMAAFRPRDVHRGYRSEPVSYPTLDREASEDAPEPADTTSMAEAAIAALEVVAAKLALRAAADLAEMGEIVRGHAEIKELELQHWLRCEGLAA
jgi:hypothetical protein